MRPDEAGGSTTKRRRRRSSRKRSPQPTTPRRSEPRARPEPKGNKTGTFWWLGGPAKVSQAYGNDNSMYAYGYHDGLDIAVPVGTSVAALTSGKIIYAGNAGADGWRVGIRTPNGRVYYYGHLSGINVRVGDTVSRGDIVARSGNTGRSFGPHVHFELQKDGGGAGESPYRFLEKWSGGKMARGKGSGPDTRTYRGSGRDGQRGGLAKNSRTADYGWSEAVFNANPELRKLLRQAQANDWDGATMQAAIRGTDWYRNHSAIWRQNWVLKRDNPEEFENRKRVARSTVDAIANEFGVELSTAERNKIAHDMMWLGLTDTEVNEAVGAMFGGETGDFSGSAGDLQDQIMGMAGDYGVRVSDEYIERLVRGIFTGKQTPQDAQNHILELAKSAYPSLVSLLDQGMTVKQIADPYIQAMSRTLELPDSQIDAYDPTVRSALVNMGKDAVPTMKPIWQFEEDLRKDPRWFKTTNAHESLLGLGNSVLKQWGVA